MSIFKMFFVVIVAYIGWGWSISFGHHGVAGVLHIPSSSLDCTMQ
ncbi:ammonium transporter [Corynebacterium diphtheriae]|nr:ammonium transporter [Corynebacterium diphtheriae]